MEKSNENVFEFVMYLNDEEKIVCGREFMIENFNPTSIRSIDVKTMMDELVGLNNLDGTTGLIPSYLKKLSKEYSWNYYNPYKEPEINRREADINLNEPEDFYFEVRQVNIYKDKDGNLRRDRNDRFIRDKHRPTTLIARSSFNANYFPRKVRHFVDLRNHFDEIIDIISSYLNRSTYNEVF